MVRHARARRSFRRVTDPELARRYRQQGWWGDRSLSDHVVDNAAVVAERAAFVADGRRLTWGAYEEASFRVAAALVGAGLDAHERVAVLVPDSATVHAVFVGAERAGMTIVGIGARAGDREIAHLMGKTRTAILVTLAEHRGEPAEALVQRLVADGVVVGHHVVVPRFEVGFDDPVQIDGEPVTSTVTRADLAELAVGPDDLYLVNSTSGTTGLPKCVMHNQNRWMYFHRKAVEHGALTGDDVFMGAVPAPFGFGLWTSHFTPTILGSPTVVAERFDAAAALEAIEQQRVSVLCCVSTQFMMMLNDPAVAERDLSSLRVMFTGGEAVPYGRAREFEQQTGCTVLQFFGSNETGVLSGTRLGDPPEKRLRTAGRVIPEMHVRLYDGDEDVTARGHGQPACKGPATCLGYLADPEANAELVTADGWMRMGDLCTIDDEGFLTLTGRTSDIIIRGGKNISAIQVEDEVATHPAVALAAAVAWPDDVFGERVCVYVETRDRQDLTLDELVTHLRARGASNELLPEHLVIVDELPRSSGGKVAKGDLRRDVRERASRTG